MRQATRDRFVPGHAAEHDAERPLISRGLSRGRGLLGNGERLGVPAALEQELVLADHRLHHRRARREPRQQADGLVDQREPDLRSFAIPAEECRATQELGPQLRLGVRELHDGAVAHGSRTVELQRVHQGVDGREVGLGARELRVTCGAFAAGHSSRARSQSSASCRDAQRALADRAAAIRHSSSLSRSPDPRQCSATSAGSALGWSLITSASLRWTTAASPATSRRRTPPPTAGA